MNKLKLNYNKKKIKLFQMVKIKMLSVLFAKNLSKIILIVEILKEKGKELQLLMLIVKLEGLEGSTKGREVI